jgi:hypothetical protein
MGQATVVKTQSRSTPIALLYNSWILQSGKLSKFALTFLA